MDAGPSYSYQHEIKCAKLLVEKDKQACMLHTYNPMFCTYIS